MGILQSVGGAMGLTPGGAALAGISTAAQIFNTIKGAKANKKNQQQLNQQVSENEADYNNTANKSFLETNTAKDVVKKLDESVKDSQKSVAGRGVITGASDEASLAANSNTQKNYNNAVSGIAGEGTQYQDNQKRMYLGRKDRLNAMQMQITDNKANSAANAASNASDLFSTVTYNSGMNDPNKAVKTAQPKLTDEQRFTD